MKSQLQIELCIDALVLDGVSSTSDLREQLSRELVDLLSSPGALDALLASGRDVLELGRLDGGLVGEGSQLGRSVGQALYRALHGAATRTPAAAPARGASPAAKETP